MGEMFNSIRSTAGIIVAIVLIGIALMFLLRALRGWSAAAASGKWPMVQGRVLSSTLQRSRRVGASGGGGYTPLVIYEYEVNGQRYQGRGYSFGPAVGTGATGIAQRALADFPVGGTVPVYYNPANPAEAVLKRTSGGSSINLVMALVMGVAAVIVLVQFGGVRLPG